MLTETDAPGDAEKCRNTVARVRDDLGAVMDNARLAVGLLDRLHADAGIDQSPVRELRGGIKTCSTFKRSAMLCVPC